MLRHPSSRRRFRRLGACAGALAGWLLAAGWAEAAHAGLPTSEDQLVATVRTALQERDLAALEELVNWDGASKMKRRAVSYQVRHSLGRQIRSIGMEPFPENSSRELEQRGSFAFNMPVARQLRVVFDEPDTAFGRPPGAVFLIGRQGDAYRIALVVPVEKPGGDRD